MSVSPIAPIAYSSTTEDLREICRDIIYAAAALERLGGSERVHAQLIDDAAELRAVRG